MDKDLYRYTKKLIKQAFPKYKRIQVGATLTEVLIDRGASYTKIPLVKFTVVCNSYGLFTTNNHQINVAVDQLTNRVYWNFERI
ncbi:hypothetical protein G9G63_08965 [Paenibacillus sp. EKM202P]|uniref:hypothetical protein n=1 Tax=unclassified Paenibacillus TaxID=185978 RepID=UPI0013ECCDF4|nr:MULTISPECIES: hypothetical protein [unclassified Paenibacillus]KAF6565281.1 hypothetical protein G9G63_08965 [Paenibacillus sp. EKM202P]KAF6569393.1 hypothetical protein G9G64_13125 [Paenibacillus sp. EKM207P]